MILLMKTPLYNAVDHNQIEIVSILLQQPGIKVNELTTILILNLVYYI